MELEPGVVVDIDVLLEENYIIPIWNWSSMPKFEKGLPTVITLFLYGIGAISLFYIFIV